MANNTTRTPSCTALRWTGDRPVQATATVSLTNRRLLMLRRDRTTAGLLKYVASVPRADATASIVEKGLFRMQVRLDVAPPARGSTATVRIPSMDLMFGLRPARREAGSQLAAALGDGVAARPDPVRA